MTLLIGGGSGRRFLNKAEFPPTADGSAAPRRRLSNRNYGRLSVALRTVCLRRGQSDEDSGTNRRYCFGKEHSFE
ncbi:hypothetical protein GOP47_0028223 [Adiantum capillus-veneris]|nr:hypothetical protein GOP47_0028223 [Adiantum capillus-veneris]